MGGAVWVAPAIQSLNMTRAWARTGSWSRDCYSVDIDIDRHGRVEYHTNDPRFRCLAPGETGTGAASMVSTVPDGAGGWIVTIPAAGAQVVEGYAEWKLKGRVVGDPCTPGTLSAPNAMRFAPATGPHGKRAKVVDIELTFCVASAEPRPGP